MSVFLSPKCPRVYRPFYGDNYSRKLGASPQPLYFSPNTEKLHKTVHTHPQALRLKKHLKTEWVGGREGGRKVILRWVLMPSNLVERFGGKVPIRLYGVIRVYGQLHIDCHVNLTSR